MTESKHGDPDEVAAPAGEGLGSAEPSAVDAQGEAAAEEEAPEAAAVADAPSIDGEAPAVAGGARLASIVESLLFASERPLALADLKRLTGERDAGKLTAVIESLRAARVSSGIQLVPVAGGWHLRTHPDNASWVSRLVAGRPPRLSRAMLETLAIVAYRQPVTRPEIDDIRGVDCGPVLKTLLERGLVRVIGKKEEVGRPMLYGTTPEFLRTFSLRDLTGLPTLREFHELGEAELAAVARADAAVTTEVEAAPPPVPPPPRAPPELDPEEEDELLHELERATVTAAGAAMAGAGPAPEPAPRDDVAADDESAES